MSPVSLRIARYCAFLTAASILSLSAAVDAFAQVGTSQAATQSGSLPEVLVTAPTTVPMPENDVASSITVITGQQIEQN